MQHPSIARIRELIRSLKYVVSLHASEELEDDNLSILDFENIVLTGQIIERQRDRNTQEVKCVVSGSRLTVSPPKSSSKSARPVASSSLPFTVSDELCAFCGKSGVHLREVTRSFRVAGSLLLIERIPQVSCPHCGESYFTAQTMHEIERIKRLRKSLAVKTTVPVATFLAAA